MLNITLKELLADSDQTIYRNAMSIFKQLKKRTEQQRQQQAEDQTRFNL